MYLKGGGTCDELVRDLGLVGAVADLCRRSDDGEKTGQGHKPAGTGRMPEPG